MARATEAEVIAIMDTSLTSSQVTPFLDAANRFVTALLGSSTSLSSDQKTDIEKFIAAHFIASAIDPQIKQEKTGDAQVTYQGTIGVAKMLESTYYGQVAISLDTSGTLATAGKKTASMEALDFIDGGTS